MAYCTADDLRDAYGADRVDGWSRLEPDTTERALRDASAEIDGYLASGGYAVPMPGPPATLRKYCIDIAAATLVLSAGVIDGDPGGAAVLEQAKVARRFLERVAEGKFRIPGCVPEGETSRPPAGNVRVSARRKLDMRRY